MNKEPLNLKLIATRPTSWDPETVKVNMNLRLDGCIVPSENLNGGRIAYSNLVVLDNFLDDSHRLELKEFLLQRPDDDGDDTTANDYLPSSVWERKTADVAGGRPTYGVNQSVLQQLAAGYPPAVVEVQSRLAKMYPEYDIAHLPSHAIQQQQQEDDDHLQQQQQDTKRARHNGDKDTAAPIETTNTGEGADCSAFLANAAVQGDTYIYHVDADPTSFPDDSSWVQSFGDYYNGEPTKPLLVTLLVYLDDDWPRDWAADTLFLDSDTDTGVFVRPKPGRAILMHQDVLHRVSAPSSLAGQSRARLSLVWKLVFLPTKKKKDAGQQQDSISIARPEWGMPVNFGSAARVEVVMRQLAREMKQQQQQKQTED